MNIPLLRAAVVTPVLVSVLAGCAVNGNHPLPFGAPPAAQRAVLVYGVELTAPWSGSAFPLDLVAYDIDRQAMAGDCLRLNRTESLSAAAPGGVHYVAFDVAPGYYTLSPFLPVESDQRDSGWRVPAGQTVYAGTFVYQPGNRLARKADLDARRAALARALPQLAPDLQPAATTTIARARPFLCTP